MSRSNHAKHRVSKEFWSRRPMRYFTSCKWAKVKCHRIERAKAKVVILKEIAKL